MNKKIGILLIGIVIVLAIYWFSSKEKTKNETNIIEPNNINENISTDITASRQEVTLQEKDNIQEYLNEIYHFFETTIPEFETINEADESWIWGVSLNRVYDYTKGEGISYNELIQSAKELFGDEFNLEPPKENMDFITYDKDTSTYSIAPRGGVMGVLGIVIYSAEKTETGYIVKTVEYFEQIEWDDETNTENLEKEKIKEALNNKETHNPKEIVLTENEKGEIFITSVNHWDGANGS